MNRYRIQRVGINNFKIFSKYFEKPFSGDDLIVFDGPNGFGKTSVFDAIELALTGTIRRLDIYDDSVKNRLKAHGFPFINNERQDFFIKIELVSENGKLIICRYVKKEELGQRDKGKIRWDRIKLGKLNAWEDSFDNATDLNQDELEGLLGIKDLDRIFNIFFYVQQEENTFFLKRSENERKEYLNILFDVDKETKFVSKIKKLLKFQKEYAAELTEEIKKAEEKKVKVDSDSSIEGQPYERIFKEKEYEWDKENPDFSQLTYKNVVDGIKNIQKLKQSKVDFNKQKEALKIRSFLSSPNFVKGYSLVKKYEKLFPEVEKRIGNGKELRAVIKSIEQNKHLDINFWESRKDLVKDFSTVDVQNIIDQVKLYLDQKGSHDKLEATRTELNRHRKSLIDKYSEYIKIPGDQKQELCPLCGNEWRDLQELLGAIKAAEKRFMTINQASIKNTLDNVNQYAQQVKTDFQKRLDDEFYPEEEILTLLRTSLRSKPNFLELDKFIEQNKLKFTSLGNLKSLDDLKDLSDASREFQDLLEEVLEKMMVIDEETYLSFENIFVKYFEESFDKLKAVDVDKLDMKLRYLGIKYAEYTNSQNAEIDKKVSSLKEKIDAVKEKAKKIKDVQDVYEKKIKDHIGKIVNDISIPFFINSGRILQEFHGGNGIFVRMGSGKSDGVKFYSDIDLENDPLYSLSSGQISSLVLAFCLTLNDVYRDHYLGMVLIDDPIQTMDEINTITFIDLIRNNFSDRQFIISTHEDNFSSLVRYKFAQNDAKVSVVRMKEAI